MKPSIGRIVHLVTENGLVCEAAIITRVHAGNRVDLTVFPAGMKPDGYQNVVYDEYKKPNTWHWAEPV